MKLFKLTLPLILCAITSIAQIKTDSLYLLKEAVVEGSRLNNFSTGSKIQKIDSAIMKNFDAANLSDLLAQHTQIFIKSYGNGNIATPSIRGTGSSHTSVLWNGFNLQAPTLGQSDLSMFPITFIDDVQIQYGGAGALFGSGSVGGAIHLNNSSLFGQGIKAKISNTVGSFSNYQQAINLKFSKQRFVTGIKVFNHFSKNDFPFRSPDDNSTVKQKNAEILQHGFLHENYFKINDFQQINLRVWGQENTRNNPGTTNASLRNNFIRVTGEWKKIGEKVNWFARAAYFNETLKYKNPLADQYSNTYFQTIITESESKINLTGNQHLNIGINNTFNKATSENKVATNGYLTKPHQNRTSVFTSYKIHDNKKRWNGILSARQEIIENKIVPFTPTLGFEGALFKGFSLSGNISRNYKIPSFDDLYWQPGGNPNLLPESGWSEEAGITHKMKTSSYYHNANFTLFNSNIENWILWQPSQSFWTPENVRSVWSRGLEMTYKSNAKIGLYDFNFSAMYNYVISTNQKVKDSTDKSLYKQLIYVPIYNGQANFSIAFKKFCLGYVHTYTGNRFTTSDNTKYINGFNLGNISFSKEILIKSFKGNINIQVNNLWNKEYQVLPSLAMPMRNYQLTFSISV